MFEKQVRGKTQEDGIKESMKKYKFIKFILDRSKEVILILSKTGKILFVNKGTLEIVGYKEKDVIGKSIINFLTSNSVKKALYALSQEFLGHIQPQMEVEIKIKSGGIRYIEIDRSSSPVYEKGKLVGLLITGRDITEHKKTEEKLEMLNQELKSKVDELEKFTKLSVGRELKIIELKKRISELENKVKNGKE